MVPMETEVDMEVEAGGVHDNGLLWESKKGKRESNSYPAFSYLSFQYFYKYRPAKRKKEILQTCKIAFAKGETYKWSSHHLELVK